MEGSCGLACVAGDSFGTELVALMISNHSQKENIPILAIERTRNCLVQSFQVSDHIKRRPSLRGGNVNDAIQGAPSTPGARILSSSQIAIERNAPSHREARPG
jgi:hypothetical protein